MTRGPVASGAVTSGAVTSGPVRGGWYGPWVYRVGARLSRGVTARVPLAHAPRLHGVITPGTAASTGA